MVRREGKGPFCPLASRKPVPPRPTEVLLFPEGVSLVLQYLVCSCRPTCPGNLALHEVQVPSLNREACHF
jgi:hypothetical protein